MSLSNADIAAVFNEIAELLELQGANAYRIRAYRNAARIVSASTVELGERVASGEALPKMRGIGADLSAKLSEIATTGSCELHERLRSEVPPALIALLRISGLGPKRVTRLHHDLGVESPQQLLEAARAGRVRGLQGFGAKSERQLIDHLQQQLTPEARRPLALATASADALTAELRDCAGVRAVTVCGSFRRRCETVGDLDLLVVGGEPQAVMRSFVHHPAVRDIVAQGTTRATVVLRSGLQVDLRAVEPEAEGAALVYFTGSKAHNLALRRLAQRQGLKINEYGVYRGNKRIAGDTEASVYQAVGLPLIPPELREDRGELAAAAAGQLPPLIERADLRGCLHAHSRASDGAADMVALARAAQRAGLEYLAITDHTHHADGAAGFDQERLLRQIDEIDAINPRLKGFTLLKSTEVEILEDGTLDLPDRVLARLDLVVGAMHTGLDLSRRKQTLRLQRAMGQRYFHVLAHPTCRLLGERGPIDVDLGALFRSAAGHGCWLELNCQPRRMDLSDTQCREARDHGVLISIACDARTPGDFQHLDYGVGQARRAWLRREDVVNTRSLAELRTLLAQHSS